MTSRLPHVTRAQGIDEWKTPSPLRKIERKGESNLVDRSKKTTKKAPNLVDCSKNTTPVDPSTAPNGVTTNDPALEPVTGSGEPPPSIKELPAETPAPAVSTPRCTRGASAQLLTHPLLARAGHRRLDDPVEPALQQRAQQGRGQVHEGLGSQHVSAGVSRKYFGLPDLGR